MKILVDADSCPKAARELVLRRSAKSSIRIIFAANRPIPNEGIAEMEICDNSENSADDRIVELAEKDDIVITRDLPLAKRLVEKGISVLDDRGRIFNRNNINEYLSLRNFTVGLAENGLDFERTANYKKKELKKFADSLEILVSAVKTSHIPVKSV